MSFEVITLWLLSGTPSSPWGFYSTEELKDVVLCTPWGEARTLPQGCTVVPGLLPDCLCIPSLPWWAAVWKAPRPRSPTGSWWVSLSQLPSGSRWCISWVLSHWTPLMCSTSVGEEETETQKTKENNFMSQNAHWQDSVWVATLWDVLALVIDRVAMIFFLELPPDTGFYLRKMKKKKKKKKSRVIEMFPFYRFSGKFFH